MPVCDPLIRRLPCPRSPPAVSCGPNLILRLPIPIPVAVPVPVLAPAPALTFASYYMPLIYGECARLSPTQPDSTLPDAPRSRPEPKPKLTHHGPLTLTRLLDADSISFHPQPMALPFIQERVVGRKRPSRS